jgi:hypothetical protein
MTHHEKQSVGQRSFTHGIMLMWQHGRDLGWGCPEGKFHFHGTQLTQSFYFQFGYWACSFGLWLPDGVYLF